MYEKEVKDQSAKVEKMKADEKDEYDIKKQVCALSCFCNDLFVSNARKYGGRGGGGDNLKLQTDQWSFLRVKVINLQI